MLKLTRNENWEKEDGDGTCRPVRVRAFSHCWDDVVDESDVEEDD